MNLHYTCIILTGVFQGKMVQRSLKQALYLSFLHFRIVCSLCNLFLLNNYLYIQSYSSLYPRPEKIDNLNTSASKHIIIFIVHRLIT